MGGHGIKRRILSFIITLALCLNLCPVRAFAADEGTYDGLCPHHPAHTDACGYVPGSPGAPCTFACQICPVGDLIGKLPGSVSGNNSGQVQAQLSEIYALYDGLTADEQQQVDLSPCISLQDQLDGMGLATLSDTPGGSDSPKQFLLSGDYSQSTPYEVLTLFEIRTNGYTFTGTNSTAIRVNGRGELYLTGTVVSKSGAGVEVLSGGILNITEPETSISGTTCALDIASGAEVHLSTGTYSGKGTAIRTADGDLAALLEPGYAYFGSNGSLLLPADAAKAKTIVVGQCRDHLGKTCTHTSGATTHTWTCPYCGVEETEACTFTFDQNRNGSCDFCESSITIVVDESALGDLVYDSTDKTAAVTLTVDL